MAPKTDVIEQLTARARELEAEVERLSVAHVKACQANADSQAELAKQNEPVAWAIYVTGDLCDVFQNKDFALLEFNRRNQLYPEPSREFRGLYTIQPTAEQIAKETAEACAKACEDVIGNTPNDQRMLAAIDCAVMLRSGAWKGFKK